MIDYSNMLDCARAHLHSSPLGVRVHITTQQLASAQETAATLQAWAAERGVTASPGQLNGYAGFWLSLDLTTRA